MAATPGELVEVHGTYWTADNLPERGTVTFTPVLSAPMSGDPSRVVSQGKVTADLDEDGSFTVRLLASDDLGWQTDGPVPYRVVERLSCQVRSYLVIVPTNPSGTDITVLQPPSNSDVVVLPVLGPPGPPGDDGAPGEPGATGAPGPPGLGIRILSAVPTVADLPAVGAEGDAHLVIESGDLWVWGTDDAWHDSGHVQGPPGPPGTAGTLNDLTDVAAPASTPAGRLLGTTAVGAWGPVDPPEGVDAALDALAPGWTRYDPAATYAEGDVVYNDGILWTAPSGGVAPGQSQPPTQANDGDWFWRLTLESTSTSLDELTSRVGVLGLDVQQFETIAKNAVRVDSTGVVTYWSAHARYSPGALVFRVEGTDGLLCFSSDIEQIGGEPPSLTNLATWTLVDGWNLVNNPSIFFRVLGDLRDVEAPDTTPAGKVLGTTAVGTWGPVDPPVAPAYPSATWSLAETTIASSLWVGTWKYLKLILPASMGPLPKFGYEDFYVPPCPPEYLAAIRENRRVMNGTPVDHYEPFAQQIGGFYSTEVDIYQGFHRLDREADSSVVDPQERFSIMNSLSTSMSRPGAATVETVIAELGDRVVSQFWPSDLRAPLRAVWDTPSDPDDPASPTMGQEIVEALGLTWPMGFTVFIDEAAGMVPQDLLDLVPAGYTLDQALVLFLATTAKVLFNKITAHPVPPSMRQSP